jgi:hypothetical protein
MKRSGRFFAAVASVVLVAGLGLVFLPGAEAQKVANPGTFSLLPLGGTLTLKNTSLDLTPHAQAQCSDGIDNDGDGKVDLADNYCGAGGAPAGLTAADDDSEAVPNYQAKMDTTITGTIDKAGNISIPAAGISFPWGYIPFAYPDGSYAGYVTIKVLPIGATGNLDPLTGIANLQVKARIQATGTAFTVGTGPGCLIGSSTNPVTLNLTTGTSGSLVGTPYSATTGTARIVDNTFAVPAIAGCAVGAVNLNSIINQQIGLPSPAGQNNAIIDGQTSPILGKGLAAKITTTPSLLSGPAPFAVDFSGATSTVSAAGATYLWTFPDGSTQTGVSVSKTFDTVGTNTVTLKVTDTDGDVSIATKNVNVTPGSTTTTTEPTTTSTTTTQPTTTSTTTTQPTTTTTQPTTTTTSTTTTTTQPTTTTTSTTTTTTQPTTTTTSTTTTTTQPTTTTTTTLPTTTTTQPTTTTSTTTTTQPTTTTTQPTTTSTTTTQPTTSTTVPSGSRDRASIVVTGSSAYSNVAESTSGDVKVLRDAIGIVSAKGTLQVPGKSGGTATVGVNVSRFWILQLWTGQVSVSDPGASASFAAPVFGSVSNAPGTNAVGGTSSWFNLGSFPNLVKPFTLQWSVDDVS